MEKLTWEFLIHMPATSNSYIAEYGTNLYDCVESKVAKGEDIKGWSIAVSFSQSFWWHVHKCPWCLGECPGHLPWSYVDNTGVTHVCDLCDQRRSEEDILSSQVPVDDRRCPFVEIDQSTGHVLQDRVLEGEREARHVLK